MSSPDTRQVVVTNDSVIIDGRDITHMVTGVHLTVTAGAVSVLELKLVPDEILYSGLAIIPRMPLNGIERLRKRLGR